MCLLLDIVEQNTLPCSVTVRNSGTLGSPSKRRPSDRDAEQTVTRKDQSFRLSLLSSVRQGAITFQDPSTSQKYCQNVASGEDATTGPFRAALASAALPEALKRVFKSVHEAVNAVREYDDGHVDMTNTSVGHVHEILLKVEQPVECGGLQIKLNQTVKIAKVTRKKPLVTVVTETTTTGKNDGQTDSRIGWTECDIIPVRLQELRTDLHWILRKFATRDAETERGSGLSDDTIALPLECRVGSAHNLDGDGIALSVLGCQMKERVLAHDGQSLVSMPLHTIAYVFEVANDADTPALDDVTIAQQIQDADSLGLPDLVEGYAPSLYSLLTRDNNAVHSREDTSVDSDAFQRSRLVRKSHVDRIRKASHAEDRKLQFIGQLNDGSRDNSKRASFDCDFPGDTSSLSRQLRTFQSAPVMHVSDCNGPIFDNDDQLMALRSERPTSHSPQPQRSLDSGSHVSHSPSDEPLECNVVLDSQSSSPDERHVYTDNDGGQRRLTRSANSSPAIHCLSKTPTDPTQVTTDAHRKMKQNKSELSLGQSAKQPPSSHHAPLRRSDALALLESKGTRTDDDVSMKSQWHNGKRVMSDEALNQMTQAPVLIQTRSESAPDTLNTTAEPPKKPVRDVSLQETPSSPKSQFRRVASNAKTALLALSRTKSSPNPAVVHQLSDGREVSKRTPKLTTGGTSSVDEALGPEGTLLPQESTIWEVTFDDSEDCLPSAPIRPSLPVHDDAGMEYWKERCRHLESELRICKEIMEEKTTACSQLQEQLGLLKKNLNRRSASYQSISEPDNGGKFGVDVCDLSVQQVCKLLNAYGLAKYEFIFKTHKINGSTFASLSHVQLEKQLGVVDRGHRDKIMNLAGGGLVQQL